MLIRCECGNSENYSVIQSFFNSACITDSIKGKFEADQCHPDETCITCMNCGDQKFLSI